MTLSLFMCISHFTIPLYICEFVLQCIEMPFVLQQLPKTCNSIEQRTKELSSSIHTIMQNQLNFTYRFYPFHILCSLCLFVVLQKSSKVWPLNWWILGQIIIGFSLEIPTKCYPCINMYGWEVKWFIAFYLSFLLTRLSVSITERWNDMNRFYSQPHIRTMKTKVARSPYTNSLVPIQIQNYCL